MRVQVPKGRNNLCCRQGSVCQRIIVDQRRVHGICVSSKASECAQSAWPLSRLRFEVTSEDGSKKQLTPPISFVFPFIAQGSIVDYFSRPENAGNSSMFLIPWAFGIASGLAHLHSHKCIHRDLYARNIFIDDNDRAIIGDLGLARPLDANGTFKSEGKSAQYPVEVGPEVVEQEMWSPASDVFQFGKSLPDSSAESVL